MDEDLDGMTREQLAREAKRLRAGIRAHRDSTSHDLCWHHPRLWGLLPEVTDPANRWTSSCPTRLVPTHRIGRERYAPARS